MPEIKLILLLAKIQINKMLYSTQRRGNSATVLFARYLSVTGNKILKYKQNSKQKKKQQPKIRPVQFKLKVLEKNSNLGF